MSAFDGRWRLVSVDGLDTFFLESFRDGRVTKENIERLRKFMGTIGTEEHFHIADNMAYRKTYLDGELVHESVGKFDVTETRSTYVGKTTFTRRRIGTNGLEKTERFHLCGDFVLLLVVDGDTVTTFKTTNDVTLTRRYERIINEIQEENNGT